MKKPITCESCDFYEYPCVYNGKWPGKARVLLLSEYPTSPQIVNSPLSGDDGALLRKLLHRVFSLLDLDKNTPWAAAYASGCISKKPSINSITACSTLWKTSWLSNYGQRTGPKVIITLGPMALKAVGIKFSKISDVRGREYNIKLNEQSVTVIPTFSVQHVYATPGIVKVVQSDILKAFKIAYQNYHKPLPIEELAKDYIIPKTIDEVKEVCEYILGYYDPAKQDSPWTWPISVDIETNTLKPFQKDAKITMVSMAWDDGKATAIALGHKECPYPEEKAWEYIKEVLESPKPKTFHNGKFDLKFLKYLKGIDVNNFSWDTMLAEHWLDEDRKGTYGLKVLAALYEPKYSNYEEGLHQALKDLEEEAAEEEIIDIEDTENPENNKYLKDPQFPKDADPNLIELYRTSRQEWFFYNSIGNGKKRGVALRRWKNAAKKLGVEIPDPKPSAKDNAEKDIGFANVDLNTLSLYAAVDADITRIVHKKQLRKMYAMGGIEDAKKVMRHLYIPGTLTLSSMEYKGVKVDNDLLKQYEDELSNIISECEENIFKLVLRKFNLNANDELASILVSEGFPVLKRTEKTKKVSVTKDILNTYYQIYSKAVIEEPTELVRDGRGALTNKGKLELVENILLYRAAYKMKNTFIYNLRKLSYTDGRIHTTFKLNGTATGRLSSSRLNLQNLPHYMCRLTRPETGEIIHQGFNVKDILIPDDDSQIFFNADIKGAELRVLAFYSQDKFLIDAINNNADLHTVFLTKVKHPELTPDLNNKEFLELYTYYFNKKESDKDIKEFRRKIKSCVFGTLYGAMAPKIAQQLGDDSPEGIRLAQEIIDSIFKAFPTIKKYITTTHREVMTQGYVKTVFGRYRRFPLASVSRRLASAAKREAVNFKIQSTSSDIVLSQLADIGQNIHELDGHVLLTVHDSISGIISKKYLSELKPFLDKWIIEESKRKFKWLPVTVDYDLEVGPTYGSGQNIDTLLEAQTKTA